MIGALRERDIQPDDRRPCLCETGEQAPVMRVPEVAWIAEFAQVLEVDPDHGDVANRGLRPEAAPELKARVEKLGIRERAPPAQVEGAGGERDDGERRGRERSRSAGRFQ
jgi:hypothetical protein